MRTSPGASTSRACGRTFRSCGGQVHGRPLVYLDNAATTQKPQVVLDALSRYYTEQNANVHRGVHHLSEVATEAYDGARGEGAALLQRRERSRDHLHAQRDREHQPRRACVRPAEAAGRRRSPDLRHGAPLEHRAVADGLRGDAARSCASRRWTIAASCCWTSSSGSSPSERAWWPITHMSNALGTVNPVAEIVRIAHARERSGPGRWIAGRVPHAAWTCRRSAPISTSPPATSCTARPASACSTDARRCSRRCRRSSAAAT